LLRTAYCSRMPSVIAMANDIMDALIEYCPEQGACVKGVCVCV
jgi:hypothetical protein